MFKKFITSYITGLLGSIVIVLFALIVVWDVPLKDIIEDFPIAMPFFVISWLIFILITHSYVKFEKNIRNSCLPQILKYVGVLAFAIFGISIIYLGIGGRETWMLRFSIVFFYTFIYLVALFFLITIYVVALRKSWEGGFKAIEFVRDFVFGILLSFFTFPYVIVLMILFSSASFVWR